MIFSANFACPECGYSMSELEPRIFSFNNPAGACPTCDGLGCSSISIPPSWSMIRARAWPAAPSAAGTSAASTTSRCSNPWPITISSTWRRPWRICRSRTAGGDPARLRADRDRVPLHERPRRRGGAQAPRSRGSCDNMERRYRETESNAVREELAKYIANQSCTSCGGSRLREEARHVFVENATCPPSPSSPSAMRWPSSKGLKLTGQRAQIADKILKEIVERLGFLVNVGLNYLSLSRTRRDPLRRRGPAHPPGQPDRRRPGRASCTCWMSPPSACTSATTNACSRP